MPPQLPPAWRLGKDNKGVWRTMAICEAESAPGEAWEPQVSDLLPWPGAQVVRRPPGRPDGPGGHLYSLASGLTHILS